MNDFIFGTLATEELRRARVQLLRGGVTHYVRRLPRDPKPDQAVRVQLSSGPSHPGERAWVYWTVDGSDPSGSGGKAAQGFCLPLERTAAAWDTGLWGYIQYFEGYIPPYPPGTVVRYRLSMDEYGAGEVFADQGAYHSYYVDDDPTPAWSKGAIIYHVFVDRFNPGPGHAWNKPVSLSGFFGGRIEGVTDKLDYIAGLGANTLWLSPVFPSPTHHGYDATDLFDIEPRLGNKADLKRLLDEAHRRGLRVLLDFVPNHWSSRHFTFQQAIADPHSPYRDWYSFAHWPDRYETFFGVKSLPQVNLRYPAARKYMLDAARFWLDFGVDGYRLDYAIGPAFDFWADFRKETRAARPDCWTFGEIVDPPDVQLNYEGLLDGALDFMLLEAMRQAFAFGQWGGERLAGFLERHESAFPASFSRPSFLDNHDMNRFLWAAGGDMRRLKLAALCQFTLAGAPIIYYGTEAGLSQQRDIRQGKRAIMEEARLPMVWDDAVDKELLDYYTTLIAVRKAHPAFWQVKRQTVVAQAACLAYRYDEDGAHLVTVLNLGHEKYHFTIPAASARLLVTSDRACQLNLENGLLAVDIPPLSGALFSLQE